MAQVWRKWGEIDFWWGSDGSAARWAGESKSAHDHPPNQSGPGETSGDSAGRAQGEIWERRRCGDWLSAHALGEVLQAERQDANGAAGGVPASDFGQKVQCHQRQPGLDG